jgi:hypothetical protein
MINAIGSMASIGATPPSLFPGQSTAPPTPAEAAKAREAAAAARQKAILDEVREKGLYAYAQEQKFEALKEKLRRELMAERGIDDAALSAMNPEQRASAETSLEQEIAKRIQEVMRDALGNEAKAAAAEGRPPKPMIIDISV